MPRFRPTTKIDVIGNLDVSPEGAVGDFLKSKQQCNFYVKQPKWDSAGDALDLLYVQNEREYSKMLQLQAEMLENYKKQIVINNKRIQKLTKVQEDLQSRFIEVNSFVKECGDKRTTAERKINEEIATQNKLKSDIEDYRQRIKELTDFRQTLRDIVQEFDPYEKVLEEVVKKCDIFESVKDCMIRCDALMIAQDEISSMEKEKMQELEEMRKRMVKITTEAALTVLGLKNDLTQLERCYKQACNDCRKWEKILYEAENVVNKSDLNRECALDGIYSLYKLLCRRRKREPTYQRHEVEAELDFIKSEIEVLIEVHNECFQSKDSEALKKKKSGRKN